VEKMGMTKVAGALLVATVVLPWGFSLIGADKNVVIGSGMITIGILAVLYLIWGWEHLAKRHIVLRIALTLGALWFLGGWTWKTISTKPIKVSDHVDSPVPAPLPAVPSSGSYPVIDMHNNTDSEASGNIVSIPGGSINTDNSRQMKVNGNIFDKDFVARLADSSYVESLLATQRQLYEDHWKLLPEAQRRKRLHSLSALEARIRAVEGDGKATLQLVDRLFHLDSH
jgi:hypothetical protein